MGEPFDSFGIQYVGRHSIETYFRINYNQVAVVFLEDILKLLGFYTIALFETDSVTRKVCYIANGLTHCDMIDDIIRMLFDGQFVESLRMENFEGNLYCEDGIEKNRIIIPCTAEEVEKDMNIRKCKKRNVKPVLKYTVRTKKCQSHAYISDNYRRVRAWDFNVDKCVQVKVIQKLGEPEETMGGYGDYICGPDTIIENSKLSKYHMFDFDKFEIKIIKLDNGYRCLFRKINGVHHAACMWATECLVEYYDQRVSGITDIERIDRVDIMLTYLQDVINIKTIYHAINCL